mmetsp:Transcript_19068/g.28205  ORF Transcript_19068/g.28205 Transcript_19068/m.28205 type:complete len:192 (-) Transcript_19068:74-649(-)
MKTIKAFVLVLLLGTVAPAVAFAKFPWKSKKEVTSGIKMSNNETTEKIKPMTWNPLRLMVLRLGFTEPAMTSPWNYQKKEGTFICAYCGHPLFESTGKYDSGSGWPSFWRTMQEGSVKLKREFDGRVECSCDRCGSHLGHVFPDGPRPSAVDSAALDAAPSSDLKTTNNRLPRYCVNGASLRFKEKGEAAS